MMSTPREETIIYTDTGIKLGEVRERLFGLISPGVIMNGKTHSVVLTNERLIFIPDDANARLKTMLAKGAIKGLGKLAGGHLSNTAMKMSLAYEGFDIFGERSVSMKYLPVGEGYTFVENAQVGLTVIRRKYDDIHENDFLSLPSTLLLLEFPDQGRAEQFLAVFQNAKNAWVEE